MKQTVAKYGTWALVTGGSGGIRLAFARELAAAGHNLILVARSAQTLETRTRELATRFKIEVDTIPMDLAMPGATAELYEQTREWLNQYIFETIEEAQVQATEWLWTYNNERPNMGIGGMTPAMKLKTAA